MKTVKDSDDVKFARWILITFGGIPFVFLIPPDLIVYSFFWPFLTIIIFWWRDVFKIFKEFVELIIG